MIQLDAALLRLDDLVPYLGGLTVYADACVQHKAGVSFSPRMLKQRIITEAHNTCLKNGLSIPTQRSINNYIAIIKSQGIKFVSKPQLRDIVTT